MYIRYIIYLTKVISFTRFRTVRLKERNVYSKEKKRLREREKTFSALKRKKGDIDKSDYPISSCIV